MRLERRGHGNRKGGVEWPSALVRSAFVLLCCVLLAASVSADMSVSRSSRTISPHKFESPANEYKPPKKEYKSYHERKADEKNKYRYKSKKMRKGDDDGPGHQYGGHCMYGLEGKLIHAPPGRTCAGTEGGEVEAGPDDLLQAFRYQKPVRNSLGQLLGRCVKGRCQEGKGGYLWPDGARYVGGFKAGKLHGSGTLLLASGVSYVGQWMAGMRWGQGRVIAPDGRELAGVWVKNEFMGESGVAPAPKTRSAKKRAPARSKQAKPTPVAHYAEPSRIRWPDLRRVPRAIGGGERDAAVLIGIGRYAHVAPIDKAGANANNWYRYLAKTRNVPVDRIGLLVNEDATVEEMRFAIRQAAKQVEKGGTLWFVFVGHGAPARGGEDGLLVGYDAQQKARSLEARSLRRSETLALLEESSAKNIQVFLDACFSGRDASGQQLVAGLQPLVVTSQGASSDPRTILMTAAGSNQYAGPLPGAGRPAFSYLALGGLRGWADRNRNGKVSAQELHDYVSSAMRALVRDRKQQPTLVGARKVNLARSAREEGPDLAELVMKVSGSSPASPR